MVAGTEQGLQKVMDGLTDTAKKYGMKINVKKTTSMVVLRRGNYGMVSLMINGQQVQQVTTFKYLGEVMADKGSCVEELKARIAMAKVAFKKSKELLTRGLKKRMVKTLVWLVALYGCETWTMKRK
jgi:hypothetical protein